MASSLQGVDLADYMSSPWLGIDDLMKSYLEGPPYRRPEQLHRASLAQPRRVAEPLSQPLSGLPPVEPANVDPFPFSGLATAPLFGGCETVVLDRSTRPGGAVDWFLRGQQERLPQRCVHLCPGRGCSGGQAQGAPRNDLLPVGRPDLHPNKIFRVDNITTANGRRPTNVRAKGVAGAVLEQRDRQARHRARRPPAGTTTDLVGHVRHRTDGRARWTARPARRRPRTARPRRGHQLQQQATWPASCSCATSSPAAPRRPSRGRRGHPGPTAPGIVVATAVSDTATEPAPGRRRPTTSPHPPATRSTATARHCPRGPTAPPPPSATPGDPPARRTPTPWMHSSAARQPLVSPPPRPPRQLRGTRHDDDVYSGGRRLRGRLAAGQQLREVAVPPGGVPRRTPRATCGST